MLVSRLPEPVEPPDPAAAPASSGPREVLALRRRAVPLSARREAEGAATGLRSNTHPRPSASLTYLPNLATGARGGSGGVSKVGGVTGW